MKHTILVDSKSQIEIAEIGNAFSEESSVEQTIMLYEIFDALKFKCKDQHKFESQLWHIAKEIKEKNFKDLIYVIETLNEFLKDGK